MRQRDRSAAICASSFVIIYWVFSGGLRAQVMVFAGIIGQMKKRKKRML
jgi:hypothetical protein